MLTIFIFLAQFFLGYLMVVFIFKFNVFSVFFFLGQTVRTKENNSVL